MAEMSNANFYETFWADSNYQTQYAFDAAVRERFPALLEVWGRLKYPRRVLDFGSGNGVLTYWMFANAFGEEVTGVEVSKTGVQFANQHFARRGLSFDHISPGQSLRSRGPFDVVVSSHVLEHLLDPIAVLNDLRSLAEWYVFEVPLENAIVPNTLAWLSRKDRYSNPVGHVQFWNRESFKSLLASTGYHVVREYRYASAPFSPYVAPWKRLAERALLGLTGTEIYGHWMSTHYAALVRAQ